MRIRQICLFGSFVLLGTAALGGQTPTSQARDSVLKAGRAMKGMGSDSSIPERGWRKNASRTRAQKWGARDGRRRAAVTGRGDHAIDNAWTGFRNAQSLGDSAALRSAWGDVRAAYYARGVMLPTEGSGGRAFGSDTGGNLRRWNREPFNHEPIRQRASHPMSGTPDSAGPERMRYMQLRRDSMMRMHHNPMMPTRPDSMMRMRHDSMMDGRMRIARPVPGSMKPGRGAGSGD